MQIQKIAGYNTQSSFKGVPIERAAQTVKSPIKVLFSDIDNTILYKGKASEEHLSSIKKLIDSGVRLILTTGRGYKFARELFKWFKMEPDTIITSAVSTIVDKDLNKLRDITLTADNMKKISEIYKKFADKSLFFRYTFDGVTYFDNLKGLFINRASCADYIDSYDELTNKGIYPTKAVFILHPEPETFDRVQELGEEIKRELNDKELNVLNSEKRYCEVMRHDASKGGSVKFLKELFGYNGENIACIGDAENDESMAQYVTEVGGMSVAMGNGTDRMKEISRFVTSDVTDFGFSKAVDEILKINSTFSK
jgi:Cof subfamily protein (haloacid dehalogenase superfamily)